MGEKLPVISGQELVKVFMARGWVRMPGRGKGSHIALFHETTRRTQIIPDHRELDRGTLRAILRQAGITADELRESL